ncbi:RNA methyltransferase [Arthrobacter rhombi]|uniref:TrmH family RNA methyltransferase n=1 Tax=Arthrobacter rhombi TaxID=71253 RepID=UPI0031DE88D5
MPVIELESSADPRVADYVALSDAALRQRTDPGRGLYIAESSKVLRRALAAGHVPRSFFLAPKWLDGLSDVLDAYPEVPAFVGAPGMLEEITGFHLHRGALAAMNRPAPVPLAEVIDGAQANSTPGRSRIAIFEDMVDHTNLGAAFRSAAAIGVNAILISPRCADPLYRRSIRVSMGTVFQIPWARIDSWPADIDVLKEAGFTLAGMTLGEGAITLDELAAEDHQHLALVFGTEGDGLSEPTDRKLDRRVTIPMMGGVDSLNVAASAAVAFYATR